MEIKKEIDQMPAGLLYVAQKYLGKIKRQKPPKKNIPCLHLKGQYDNVNIRQKAYE